MRFEEQNELRRFEQVVLPHLATAYNLARWLTRNEQDAEDLVQEAYLRAFKFFDSFRGSNSRAWLLTIVRNCFYSHHSQKGPDLTIVFEEEIHGGISHDLNPEMLVLQSVNNQLLKEALEELPVEYREVIVLRELEELSYKEIAELAGVPIGTVMSRLARARKRLQERLSNGSSREASFDL